MAGKKRPIRFCSEEQCFGVHFGKDRCVLHYRALPEVKKRLQAWTESNKGRVADLMREWRESNREYINAYRRTGYRENPQAFRARTKRWEAAHPEELKVIRRTNRALRRSRKARATPSWADLDAIKKIYADCPPGYHVDHFYPLKSDWVCGLHVHNNLQHLPAAENIRKSNKPF